MAKITVNLSDELEERLRSYVTSKYPMKPYGKLSEVVSRALEQFLEKTQS